MSAPSSPVDICNLSMDYLDEDSVVDITSPNTDREATCKRWYDPTRQQLLRSYPWNFAIKRAILAADVETPISGYDQQFSIPNDFLKLLTISDENNINLIKEDYQFEDGKILVSNNGSGGQLKIRYVKDFVDVPSMDASFKILLAAKTAFNMAYKFTESNTVVQRLQAQVDLALKEARNADSQERPPTRILRSAMRDARQSLGTRNRTLLPGDR
jgi:hypothetical protein